MENTPIPIVQATREISKEIKRISWLIGHLERCKKEEDKTRLIIMIAVSTIYVAKLTETVISILKEMKDLLFPKHPQIN